MEGGGGRDGGGSGERDHAGVIAGVSPDGWLSWWRDKSLELGFGFIYYVRFVYAGIYI